MQYKSSNAISYPSMHPCIEKPYGFNLSKPSACHT